MRVGSIKKRGFKRDTMIERSVLAALSRKAGLPPDAWKSPDALFQTFTSEVFSEV